MKKAAIGIVAFAAAIGTHALAADMPLKAPPPTPVAPYSWTGFYVGVSGGYGWSNAGIDLAPAPVQTSGVAGVVATSAAATPGVLNTHPHGFLGGGQMGYNYQADRWLWGVEADASYADFKGSNIESGTALFPPASLANITAVGEQRLNFFGTLRGRAGFLPTNSLLVYATGGLAYGHAESSTNTSDAGAPILTAPASGSASRMLAGWTAGGGLEAALPVSSAWRFKIEYLYYDLGKLTYTLSPAAVCAGACATTIGFVTTTASANFHGSIVRIGLNYEFH